LRTRVATIKDITAYHARFRDDRVLRIGDHIRFARKIFLTLSPIIRCKTAVMTAQAGA